VSLVPPTIQAISSTIIAQLEASLSQSIPLLPKSWTHVLAKVLAGVFIQLYKYASFQFLQLFVAYATMNETEIAGKKVRPLVEWGRLIGVGDPYAASRAEIVTEVTVLNQVGDLPANSPLVRSETGIVYTTVAAVPLNAPTVLVTIRASADPEGGRGAGVIGNLEPGEVVSFANPLPNIFRDAVVVSQTKAGADAETPDAYRKRIIRRFQARPQGGALADYRMWAEEVPGIVTAYVYTGTNPGEVNVFCEATPESSGSDDGIPTEAQLTAVFDNINLDQDGKATRRPAGAAVNTLPISRQAFDVTIVGLLPDTADNRDAILESVEEYLFTRQPYIVGLSQLPREDRVTQAAVGGVVNETAAALGAAVTDVMISPGPSSTLEHGQKAKLGNAVWT
jgi:uncharacterized phage protein gp47/JayE